MEDHTFGLPLFPLTNLELSDSAFHHCFYVHFFSVNASGRMARKRRAFGVEFHSKLLNITPHCFLYYVQQAPLGENNRRYVLRHSIKNLG